MAQRIVRPHAVQLADVRVFDRHFVSEAPTLCEHRFGATDQLLLSRVVLCRTDPFDAAQLRHLGACHHAGQHDPHLVDRGPSASLLRLTHCKAPRGCESVNRNSSNVSFPLKHYSPMSAEPGGPRRGTKTRSVTDNLIALARISGQNIRRSYSILGCAVARRLGSLKKAVVAARTTTVHPWQAQLRNGEKKPACASQIQPAFRPAP